MSGYELWDTLSGNLLDYFDTEADALHCVRNWFEMEDLDPNPELSLLFVFDDGKYAPIADGQELVSRARAAAQVKRP
jgi:hypothetical protein